MSHSPPGSAKVLVTALRSLLRFLFLQGCTTCPLAQAVPTATGWADQSLPRALGADAVTALLKSCDRHTVVGMRDFAILTLLARLGLRAGEVAALTLEDIDWHHGEMVVRGKGGRQERLPLPADVGEAVVTYLRHRPGFACRALFLKVRAPVTGLSSDGVQDVVRGSCLRAGLPPAGAHRLRHHAATAMLACGASLSARCSAVLGPGGHGEDGQAQTSGSGQDMRRLTCGSLCAPAGQPVLNPLLRLGAGLGEAWAPQPADQG